MHANLAVSRCAWSRGRWMGKPQSRPGDPLLKVCEDQKSLERACRALNLPRLTPRLTCSGAKPPGAPVAPANSRAVWLRRPFTVRLVGGGRAGWACGRGCCGRRQAAAEIRQSRHGLRGRADRRATAPRDRSSSAIWSPQVLRSRARAVAISSTVRGRSMA